MKKRIITKIGDIFCAEIDRKYKNYFQYISNDSTQLNSSVIRVFNSHYPIDAAVSNEMILNDNVAFYAHTVLRAGIQAGAWNKVGFAQFISDDLFQNIYFCNVETSCDILNKTVENHLFGNIEKADMQSLWRIWRVNEPAERIKDLSSYKTDSLALGAVYPYSSILFKMKYGYYPSAEEYSVINRKPRPAVNSFVKRRIGDTMQYLHFIGETAVREIDIFPNRVIRIKKDETIKDTISLFSQSFGTVNLEWHDFIDEKDFEHKWNQQDIPATVSFISDTTIFKLKGIRNFAVEGNDRGLIDRRENLQFMDMFPTIYEHYQQRCKQLMFSSGDLMEEQYGEGHVFILGLREIINSIYVGAKRKEKVVKDIYLVIDKMLDIAEREHITEIAMSSIGLGLCGLTWEQLQTIIQDLIRYHHNTNLIVVRT